MTNDFHRYEKTVGCEDDLTLPKETPHKKGDMSTGSLNYLTFLSRIMCHLGYSHQKYEKRDYLKKVPCTSYSYTPHVGGLRRYTCDVDSGAGETGRDK